MGCEEHKVPLATSENGDVTVAPLAGLLTETLVAGVDETGAAAFDARTVMVTSVTHEAPWFPHAFT